MRKRPSYHKYYPKRKLADLTYIIGIKCSDGVVLVSDRKYTLDSGLDFIYEDKLFSIKSRRIAVGFSGNRGTFELFRVKIIEAFAGKPMTKTQFILETSDILWQLHNKFRYTEEKFDALLAVSDLTGKVELKYFYPDGKFVPVSTVHSIGSGSPYGMIFQKEIIGDNMKMTMMQAAEIGHFIVSYIEGFDLTASVGVKKYYPQIVLVPHTGTAVEQISDIKLLEKFEESAQTRMSAIKKQVGELFKSQAPSGAGV